MKKIPLTQGKFALVDDDDYRELSKHRWHCDARKGGIHYATRATPMSDPRWYRVSVLLMHREVMSPPENMDIDHKDGDGLNNQKGNLRICTRSRNLMNQRKRRSVCGNGSKYKGVYSKGNKWRVAIMAEGVTHQLGTYVCEKAAAREYDKLARLLHGEFACLNFPKRGRKKKNSSLQ